MPAASCGTSASYPSRALFLFVHFAPSSDVVWFEHLLVFSLHFCLSLFLLFSGLCSGSFDANMNEALARVRGPFTPTQWLELERQALIYKHIVANVAIPPSLFIPFRTSLSTFGFSSLPVGSFGSSTCKAYHAQDKICIENKHKRNQCAIT